MVHQLVVPESCARLHIQCHDAAGKKIVTQAVSAVPVVGGGLGRQVDNTPFSIGGEGGPYPAVTGIIVGTVFPGFGTRFTVLGDDMKRPQPFTGPHIETADVPWYIFGRGLISALDMGRAHDNYTIDDNRRRGRTDKADGIHTLRNPNVCHEIQDSIISEAGYRITT